MGCHLTIPIYQRKEGRELDWITVGLGPLTEEQQGHSAVKMQRKLLDRLRRAIAAAEPEALEQLQLRRGTRLDRLRLELNVKSEGGTKRLAGLFPVISEPRWLGDDEQVRILYHPRRQKEWLALSLEEPLEEPLAAFFKREWAGLSADELEELKSNGKDSLRSVSFSATPPCLTDTLGQTDKERRRQKRRGAVLAQIGTDSTRRVIEEAASLGMPRSPYRAQMQLLLGARSRRPVIVAGEPGCGKTTVIERWIRDLADEEAYPIHRNLDKIHHVWTITGKRLIAGMSHLGDWEKRCIDLLEEAKRRRAILWVEDLHLFGRLGQTRDSDRSLADFFRGPIARGELVIVGESTPEQLQRLEDDAPSFAALFSRVRIEATTPSETLQMAISEARRLELEHGCAFHPFAFRTVLEVGGSLFPWKAFPGKALDIVRRLAESAGGRGDPTDTIGPADVIRLLAEQTGLAEQLLTLDRRLDLETVRQSLARRVMGQPTAIEAASDLIVRIRAGLTDPARPYAVHLFTGPTGTGKTELAKSIAEYLFGDPARLTRFDMSEYAGPDATARLIGDRWSPAGQLTRRLREQPFAVVLLDEIEKAHRSVLNLLLQVFDEGRVTDAAGNSASFQQTVIIMTSNLGARSNLPIGFGERTQAIMAGVDRAVRDFFPPELFNRIDRVVPFAPLTTEVAEQIATKELARLLGRRGLIERNVFVYANQAVRERIVAEAFDARYGARTVKRYLEHEIGSLLTDELNRAERAPMRVMRLYDSDGAFQLHVEPLVEAEPARAAWLLDGAIEQPALQLWPLLDESMRLLEAALERRGPKPTAADARYYQDRFDNRVAELRERYEAHRRHAGGPDPELLEVDAFSHDERPNPSGFPSSPLSRIRRFDRRAMAPRGETLGRDQLLRQIGEACLFARCADRIGETGMHDVWVELLRVGQAGEHRPALPGPGLLDWMVQAYAVPGYVERIGARFPDGRTNEINGDAPLGTLEPAGMQRPIHAIVHISGLFAREAYAGEEGCHIWRSFSAEPEIVRVRVLDAPAGATPRDLLGAHAESVERFERALEEGADPLPDNPERMLPTVRTLTFRPPLRPREFFEVEVEDFHLGWAGRRQVTAISQVLLDLWLLRMSRRPEL